MYIDSTILANRYLIAALKSIFSPIEGTCEFAAFASR